MRWTLYSADAGAVLSEHWHPSLPVYRAVQPPGERVVYAPEALRDVMYDAVEYGPTFEIEGAYRVGQALSLGASAEAMILLHRAEPEALREYLDALEAV